MSNILFFAAHPDDVEVCAGGTLAKHVANGDNVTVIIGCMPYESDSTRRIELANAAKFLGYDYATFFFEKSTVLTEERSILRRIESKFMSEAYSRVYVVHVGDSHQEHRLMAEVAMSFCRDNVSDLIMCQPAIPGGMTHRSFIPNMYVNIDEYIDTKSKAIAMHKSQVEKYSPRRDWISAIIARDRANGQLIHCQYAEAFEIIKIIER